MYLIVRAMRGGKAVGRDCRNHLISCMSFLHFKTYLDDPNVWIKSNVKADDTGHYECLLLCTDDASVIR